MPEEQRLGWSKGSDMVGYITLDPSTPGTLQGWAAPVKGGDPVLLTSLTQAQSGRGAVYQTGVQWSPDGFWLTVAGVNNPSRVLRWPLASGHDNDQRDIPGGEPDWAPDSKTIVYAETLSGGLDVFQMISSEATPFLDDIELVGTRLGEYGKGPAPRWSPASRGADSDILAFRSTSTNGEPQVGFKVRNGTELYPVPPPSNNPSWSPRGDTLVVETGVLRQDTLGPRWAATGLGIVKVNLRDKQTVTPLVQNAQGPAWGK
jgi:Tol biopolymer transport system component